MTTCFFCGSFIEGKEYQEFCKSRGLANDRYFIDRRKGYEKTICRVCAPPYMNRQFVDTYGTNPDGTIDGDKFADFVMQNFRKEMLGGLDNFL